MGGFSYTFADYGNLCNLKSGKSCYLYCPDGTILYEPSYDGCGQFAGKDVYELVADWNREFLSEHPDFEILGFSKGKRLPVSRAEWYSAYADLSKSREEVAASDNSLMGWRGIGIAIACHDWQNEKLPYPIKVAKKKSYTYEALPASYPDPAQGCKWGKWDFFDVMAMFEGHMKDFDEDKITDTSCIETRFEEKSFKVVIIYDTANNLTEELFSVPFFASRPTAEVKSIANAIEKRRSVKLGAKRAVVKNRNTPEGKALEKFYERHAWVCAPDRELKPIEVKVSGVIRYNDIWLCAVESGISIPFRDNISKKTVDIFETKDACVKFYANAMLDKAKQMRNDADNILAAAKEQAEKILAAAAQLEDAANKELTATEQNQ